jgi:hypothetical protein
MKQKRDTLETRSTTNGVTPGTGQRRFVMCAGFQNTRSMTASNDTNDTKNLMIPFGFVGYCLLLRFGDMREKAELISNDVEKIDCQYGRRKAERVVLDNLSEKILECYRHAGDCERQAAGQTDPFLRKAFLDTAASWVKLAQNYELEERATRLMVKPRRQK